MSFRSMLLLRRSTDFEDEERIFDPNVTTDKIEGAVIIVETRSQELSHLAAILESLNFQTLNVTEDSVALRLIYQHSPRLVLSSRRLPSLKGYSLHRDLPETAPFVYVPEPDGSFADRVPQEGDVLSEPETNPGPALEDSLVTVEDVVKGFRDSEIEEGIDPFDDPEESNQGRAGDQAEDSTVEQVEDEEDLARIQRYRAEYQAQQEDQEALADQVASVEEEERPNSFDPQGDLMPPGLGEEYSIIERIDAEEITGLPHEDVLSEKTDEANRLLQQDLYHEARSYVLNSIRAADGGRTPSLVRGKSIAERIVSSVEAGSELLLSATDRRQEFAISTHSVNTSVFAVRIGMTLGLSRWQQLRIALAALLHEIGVVRLPKQLIFKAEKPTLEEIKVLRKRPIYAARCLKGVESRYDWLPEVVGQVYERENGTGHPLGLTGREICEEAKVIGIADLFDACIHRRPYREALTGYQALFELTTDQARTFSDRIVKALIKSLSLFPYNEFVVLSSGEIGKVVDINLENLSRPLVEVIYDKEGAPVEPAEPIDLAQNPSLYIAKAVPFRSLPSAGADAPTGKK